MSASKTPPAKSASTEPEHKPKYLQIVDAVRKGLLSGQYAPGVRLPSEAELVRRFKVSRMTAAKAMLQLEREGLLLRKIGSGSYAADAHVARPQVFGLLIPDLGETEIFEPICRGMVRSPQAKGLSLLWGHSFAGVGEKGQQALELCHHYLKQQVSGIFFAPLEFSEDRERINHDILAELDHARVPVVLLDRCALPFPRSSRHDLVGMDNRRAGYMLTDHLLAMGASRFAFVSREGSVETVQARVAGCREALAHAGMDGPDLLHFEGDTLSDALLGELKQRRTDAVLCANDHTAASLMKMLLAHGVRVPEEIRIAGFDDVRYAELLPVPLTTVHQPCAAIGVAAMAAMLDRIENKQLPPRSVLIDGHLVVRSSCGAGLEKTALK